MHQPLRVALIVAAFALVISPSHADDVDVAPFTLAILRQDGILVPFVTWTGKEFENSWPVPEKEVDTPITLDAVPKRWWGKPGPTATWHVMRPDKSTAEARATTPAWFPAHCQQGLGLRTSLTVRRPVPPQSVQPYPKAGVAASRRLDFQPIESLDPSGPVGKALLPALERIVNTDEDEEANRHLMEGWKHPYDASERHRQPLKIEALYRAPARSRGAFIHYFEAVKRYPRVEKRRSARSSPETPADPKSCELVTVVAGWFVGGNDVTSVKPSLWRTRMTSCDYEAVDVMLPFAQIEQKGMAMWVAQLSGWGRERYALIDAESIDEKEKVLWSAPGGVCK